MILVIRLVPRARRVREDAGMPRNEPRKDSAREIRSVLDLPFKIGVARSRIGRPTGPFRCTDPQNQAGGNQERRTCESHLDSRWAI